MNTPQDELTSRIEISVSCRNLRDMDTFSKSDPVAVLFQKFTASYMEIGRTEIIKNNLNPNFSKRFEINYHFEERQLFKFEIYDVDSKSNKLSDHDFLGRFEFSLGELASRKKLEAKLVDNRAQSTGKPQLIILTCTELPSCKESIILQINAYKVDKKDIFGKSDPILQVYRCDDPIIFIPNETNINNAKNFTKIYQTKPIMRTYNPQWPEFELKLNKLCYGDKDRLIKFVCTDWNANEKLNFIGECLTSVTHLLQNKGQRDCLNLINERKNKKKKKYKNSGTMTVNQALIQSQFSFFDFISGGTELSFTVAIDFTASNGEQNKPNSLHCTNRSINSGMGNQYETAIKSVGSIIQDYDIDKVFPAFGFGARIPPNNDVSHCFPINFCPENPRCHGVDGLLSSYQSAIQCVKLFGPTNFAPSIKHVQEFALSYKDGSKYFVLLIITDGIITDLDATIEAIIDCSFLPMSIIIIGVGKEDFSAMDILDCDNGRLKRGQKVADRDIVQFVALREFIDQQNLYINQAALSKAVLFELPDQVTEWMKNNSIRPLPPKAAISPYTFGDTVNIPPDQNSTYSGKQPSNPDTPYPVNNSPVKPSIGFQDTPYPVNNSPVKPSIGFQNIHYSIKQSIGFQDTPYPVNNSPVKRSSIQNSPYPVKPPSNQDTPYPVKQPSIQNSPYPVKQPSNQDTPYLVTRPSPRK